MEMSSLKSEVGTGSRGLCTLEGDISMTKCVKRRRRSPSLALLNQGIEQQQPQAVALVDQPNAATTTTTSTVKRSSRFRGVSRSNLFNLHK